MQSFKVGNSYFPNDMQMSISFLQLFKAQGSNQLHMQFKKIFHGSRVKLPLVFCIAVAALTAHAASNDEIQVYDDAISKPGEAGVDLHMNFVPSGVRESSYPKEIPAQHDFRVSPEFAYGLNRNWEAGLYLPAIRAADGNWYAEGTKVRLKFMSDNPEQEIYWGLNGELGISSHRTELHNWNFELRPIIGYRMEHWNLSLNPILGFALSGHDHTPDFSPAIKISRKVTEKTWINIENYSDFGPVNNMRSHVQETYLTADTEVFGHDLNFGLGHGWTNESNDWTIKAIFNVPF